ncbi:MAG: transglutaminase-like domain-containing protein [Actinomycetia bacterium]|nr:transglutaminase-like domain-containing protein [Actinomycetes bacterium]
MQRVGVLVPIFRRGGLVRVAAIVALIVVAAFLAACDSLLGGGSAEPVIGVDNPGHPRDNTPRILEAKMPGVATASDYRAVLDYSNSSSGYVCAETKVAGKFKVLILAPDNSQYQYTITSPNSYITMPLSRGNGGYTIDFYQNVYGDSYAALFQKRIEVNLNDSNLPFLYPNQYVEFGSKDKLVQLSEDITKDATSEIEAINAIYMWCVTHISYDYDKAANIQPGYLPNNNDTISTSTGICFDYAVLCASMLRVQGIPCRLEIGYCGQAYHAWISVYSSENGVIRREISFSPSAWTRLDPTFDSAGKGTGDITRIIGDGSNYRPIYYY